MIVAFGRKGTQRPARMLARHGYGVLIFDRRGEGESDGDPNPYAWDEGERDLLAAMEFLKRGPDVEPETHRRARAVRRRRDFLQAAAHSEDVQAVVSEGASARSVGELAQRARQRGGPGRLQRRGHGRNGRLLGRHPAAAPDRPRRPDRAARAVPDPRPAVSDGEERELQPRLLRAPPARPKAIWGVPEARPRRRAGGPPARVRAASHRFFDDNLRKEQR